MDNLHEDQVIKRIISSVKKQRLKHTQVKKK